MRCAASTQTVVPALRPRTVAVGVHRQSNVLKLTKTETCVPAAVVKPLAEKMIPALPADIIATKMDVTIVIALLQAPRATTILTVKPAQMLQTLACGVSLKGSAWNRRTKAIYVRHPSVQIPLVCTTGLIMICARHQACSAPTTPTVLLAPKRQMDVGGVRRPAHAWT